MLYNVARELAFIVAETYKEVCEVADDAELDRENVLDMFEYMFKEVREEIDPGTFDTNNRSYLS